MNELPEYPASLPQYPLRDSLRIQPEDNVARSPTDTGPGKQRPRSRLEVIRVRCATKLPSRAALEALLKFHRETLAQGSQRFAWPGLTDNIPNGTYQALQFAAKPSWQPAGATAYRVDMELLALPADPGIDLLKEHWLSALVDTVSRNSIAWFFNANGVLEKAEANVARFNYDPATGDYEGLLVQRQWTNSLHDPRDPSTASWTANGTPTFSKNAIGLDGVANSAYTITDDNASGFEAFRQDKTVADNSASHAVIFPVKKTTAAASFPGLTLQYLGGTTQLSKDYTFNTDTGTLTVRSSRTAADRAVVHDWGDYWGVEIAQANNSAGNTTLQYVVWVAVNTDGGGTWNSTTTGSVVYDFGGIFLNSGFAPQTPVHDPNVSGAAVTQSADDVTSTIGGEFNADEFSFVFKGIVPEIGGGLAITYGDSTSNERVFIQITSGHKVRLSVNNGGLVVVDISSSALTPGDVFKAAVRVKENDVALSVNGATPLIDNTVSVPQGLTTRHIGNLDDTPQHFNSTIATIGEIPRALTDAELQAKSAL